MDRHLVKFAAALSLIETSLGSLLHAFHVPFRGQFLSMNQGFVLSRASFTGADQKKDAIELTQTISFTTACLKSLSPAGKRLTPMLAISVQGLLFSFGQFVGGVSVIGHTLGIWLLSLWAMSQPLLLGWILNGENFIHALKWSIEKVSPDHGVHLVLGFIALVLSVGLSLVIISKKMSAESWERYQARLTRLAQKKATHQKYPISPLAVVSVLFTFAFLYFTESPEARSIWVWLRPLAVIILMIIIAHFIPLDKLVEFLKTRSPRLAQVLDEVRNSK